MILVTAGLRSAARHRWALAYAAVALVAASVCLTWFEPGRFIAGGDIAPFIFDGYRDEYLWLWNHAFSGAGSRSYQIAYSPLLWANWGVHLLGGSDVLAQRVVMVTLITATGLSFAYFVGAFTSQRTVLAASGLLGVFNMFVLVNVLNPLVLITLALMGMLGGMILRASDARPGKPWVFATCTVGASVLAFNPPLLAVLVLWIILALGLALAIAGYDGFAMAGRILLRAAPLAVLLNVWWLVPTFMTLFGADGSEVIAQRDVVSWSWTHARSSISNVLTMTSAWGLDHPEYFPYAAELESPPLALLRFGLPLAALAAPLLTSGRRRRFALTLTATALACIFLGKGLHPPLAGGNLWLYEHVPGFWLLREPAAKVGLLQLLTFVALTALTVSALLDRRQKATGTRRHLLAAGPVVAVVAMAAFPYPLWTGQITTHEGSPERTLHVAVPEAWRDTARFVNRSSLDGKVLVLPLNDYYQMPTTWGYYGADLLPQSLLTAPVLARTGDGYFGAAPGFQDQLNAIETALLAGDVAIVPRLLRSLGVSHVLLRRDFDTSVADRSFTHPDRLGGPLATVPGLRLARTFGPLNVYSLTDSSQGPVATYGALIEAVGPEDQSVASLVSRAGPHDAISRDVANADGVALRVEDGSTILPFSLPGPGPFVLSRSSTAAPSYQVRSTSGGTGSFLELTSTDDVVIDGVPLAVPPAVFPVPAAEVSAIRVGPTVRELRGEGVVLPIPPRTPLIAFGSSGSPALGEFGPVGDCHREDDATASESGLQAEPLPEESQPAFRLSAERHSACISAAISPSARDGALRVSFHYRSQVGAPARFCIWQEPVQRCVDLPPLPVASDWTPYDAVFAPDPAATSLALYLYADAPPTPGATRNEYRAVAVRSLTPVLTTTVVPPQAALSEQALAPGDHVLSTNEPKGSPKLRPFSSVGDCAKHDQRTPVEAGLSARLTPSPEPLMELRSRAHSACVTAALDDYTPGFAYRLRIEYRTIAGAPARLCVWQEGPGTCARTPALERSTAWRRVDATFTPSEDTSGLTLYLYADGPARGETVVEYRQFSLAPISGAPPVFIKSQARVADPPPVSSQSDGPARYHIRLGQTSGPFVIGLPESYSPGWKLRGFPRGTIVEHVTLDGYANGWRVRGVLPDGPLHLVATYEPAVVARKALVVSQLTALGLVGALLWRRAGRRIPVLRMLARRKAVSGEVDDAVGSWSSADLISPAPARASAPPVSAVRSTDSVRSDWRGMSRARLTLGVLVGAAGFGCAVGFSPSSVWVVVASVLGIAVFSPPWKWLFGAGLAGMTLAVGASAFGAEQDSDVLVTAALVALGIAIALATVQTATRSTPAPGEAGVVAVAAVPYAPQPEPIRSAMVPSSGLLTLSAGERTQPVTTDGRRGALAKLVYGLDVNTILDVGCGRSFLLPTLARNPRFEMHGVDVYPEHERSIAGYPTTAGRRLPHDDAAFDCVILGDVVEHVQEPDPLLGEVRRVLRPGGWLVISTPNVVSWANRVLVPLGAHPRLTGTVTDANVQLPLFTVSTPRSLELLLKTTGYAVLRKEGTPSCFPFPLSLADRALSRYPSVASGLLYVARRNDD